MGNDGIKNLSYFDLKQNGQLESYKCDLDIQNLPDDYDFDEYLVRVKKMWY